VDVELVDVVLDVEVVLDVVVVVEVVVDGTVVVVLVVVVDEVEVVVVVGRAHGPRLSPWALCAGHELSATDNVCAFAGLPGG
ncbi:MAG: hypothetical protein ACKOYM_02260, partial [Actinomycetes bacterium]